MLCLFFNTTQAADNNRVLSKEKEKIALKFFQKQLTFCNFTNETSYFILPKKTAKRTVCRQPRKTLPEPCRNNLKLRFLIKRRYYIVPSPSTALNTVLD
jgi:hypothetical protein